MNLRLLLRQLLLIILAVFTFTQIRTRNPRHETLTILLSTICFFAVAASNVHGPFCAFLLDLALVFAAEGVRVFFFCFLDDQVADVFEFFLVVAVDAAAVGGAEAAVAETLAVEF